MPQIPGILDSDQTPQSMYQSTVSQIYNLCTLGTSVLNSGHGAVADKLVIARIFWYTYVHEGNFIDIYSFTPDT